MWEGLRWGGAGGGVCVSDHHQSQRTEGSQLSVSGTVSCGPRWSGWTTGLGVSLALSQPPFL